MATFTITDRIAVWVDFRYEVEANTAEEALARFKEGEYDLELGYVFNEFEPVENTESYTKVAGGRNITPPTTQ